MTKKQQLTKPRRPAIALWERIANDGRSPNTFRLRCTLPDENERPIVLILDSTDVDTITHHARRFRNANR